MHPDLEHLVALDRLDREIERADKAMDDARADLVKAGEAHEEAKRFADALQEQLAQSRTEQHAAERQAKRYRDRRKSAQSVLESGVGDYEAAERQISECERILDDLETTILEQLELQDDLAKRMRAAEQEIVDTRDALAVQRDATPTAIVEQRELRQKLVAERTTHSDVLDSELLRRYQRVCARKKRAVAPVRDGACAACMQMIKPQERVELKRNRLVECDNCHRWLWVADGSAY